MPANAVAARCSTGAAAARPSVNTQREPVQQQIARTRRVRAARGRSSRPARRRAGCRRSPAARRTALRSRRRDRSRARAAGRAARASSRPGAAAAERRCRGPGRRRPRRAAGPRGLARARPAARPRAAASSPSAASNAPACRLACAAASMRSRAAGRIDRQVGRPPQERRRGGEPATCLRPARRPLELRRDVLVRASRGLRTVPGAAIRLERAHRSPPPAPRARVWRSGSEADR